MKKIRLLLLPLIALSICSCDKGNPFEAGGEFEITNNEFDFNSFTRGNILDTLSDIQETNGFSIAYRILNYDDVNAEPSFVSNITIGGKSGYTWAYETTNGNTKGAAIKVDGTQFVTYLYENNAWEIYHIGDYVDYQLDDEAARFVTDKVNELVLKDDYISRLDFTNPSGSTSVCSRPCYKYTYSGDYYLSVAVDKILGITMSMSVTFVDNYLGTAYRQCVLVDLFSITNVEIPAFPLI